MITQRDSHAKIIIVDINCAFLRSQFCVPKHWLIICSFTSIVHVKMVQLSPSLTNIFNQKVTEVLSLSIKYCLLMDSYTQTPPFPVLHDLSEKTEDNVYVQLFLLEMNVF